MTNSVQLAVGMYGITRDGKRVGPFGNQFDNTVYVDDMCYWLDGTSHRGVHKPSDIIAAGYTWTDLGAKVGDTVRRVWNEVLEEQDDFKWVVSQNLGSFSPCDSLYVIVKRAEPVIEWGEWVDEGVSHNFITGQAIQRQHRLPKPKPPVVESCCTTFFGKTIKITSTDGVVTAEVMP